MLIKILVFILLNSGIAKAESGPIIITEIQLAGEKSTEEFVEILNQSNARANLKNWRLAKKTASGSEFNLLTEFPDFFIEPDQYLLISHRDYPGTSSLRYSTQQSLAEDNTVMLYSDQGETIADQIALGLAAPNPPKGSSVQRQLVDGKFGDDFFQAAPTPLSTSTGPKDTQPPPRLSPKPPRPIILFNELYPNPVGSDQEEFIELKNWSEHAVYLTFWQIVTNNGSYLFEPEAANEFVLWPRQILTLKRKAIKLSLNNGEENLKLINHEGRIIDQVQYDSTLEGASLIRYQESKYWRWSAMITPGQENLHIKPNRPPVAEFQSKGESAGENLVLDASDSFDPDGDDLQFSWTIKGPEKTLSNNQEIVELTSTAVGEYLINLKITDSKGVSSQKTRRIKIKKAAWAGSIAFNEPPSISTLSSLNNNKNLIIISLLLGGILILANFLLRKFCMVDRA